MTDTVRVTLEQIDESTGEPISKQVTEWFGNDRNLANIMSLTLDSGMEKVVEGWAEAKSKG